MGKISTKDKIVALQLRGYSDEEIIKKLGLSADELGEIMEPKRLARKSKRHLFVEEIIKTNYPFLDFENEHHIGEGLYLDIYIPSLQLCFEIDGIQHTQYSAFFHRNENVFFKQLYNDTKKEKKCKELGIVLHRISDEMTDMEVADHVIEQIRTFIENK